MSEQSDNCGPLPEGDIDSFEALLISDTESFDELRATLMQWLEVPLEEDEEVNVP